MPYYKILKAPAGRWGEGWQVGDVVEMDPMAADKAVREGEIVSVPDPKKKDPEKKDPEKTVKSRKVIKKKK